MKAPGKSPLWCGLLMLAVPLFAQNSELMVLKETGPRDKRVNLVILGDGYTAGEKELFRQHAQKFADGVVVKDLPLSEYTGYFNIYAIFAASQESGADQNGVFKNTAFDAAYNATVTRLLTVNTTKIMAVVNQHVPGSDLQFCVVNSSVYGGSGGRIAVANFNAPEIIAHEVGHTFADLGDEYEYAGSSPRETPNTTKQTVRNLIRWTQWIAAATALPTPETATFANTVGLFEGAAYSPAGWFRPKQNCRMRTNGTPFCPVCSEAYILSVYDHVSPVDSFLPPNQSLLTFKDRPVELQVTPMKPTSFKLRVEWFVDGVRQPEFQGAAFQQALPTGRHRVMARVSDTTSAVRLDPDGLLSDSVSWDVESSGFVGVAGQSPAPLPPAVLRAETGALFFRLPGAGPARVRVYGPGGGLLRERNLGSAARGTNKLAWGSGEFLPPGWYFVELRAAGKTMRKRCLIRP